MNELEIEVKFLLTGFDTVRHRLISLGAVSGGSVFESNIRFDDAAQSLLKKHALLRIRKDTQVRLTYKEPISEREADIVGQFKVLRELEVAVSDGDTLARILGGLGFSPVQIYEKRRETFTVNTATVCLDLMPFGHFLEIEGEKAAIVDVAGRLGLQWERRILANYLALFDHLRRACGLGFTDVTFDHFQKLDRDFKGHLRLFEMGS